jgi:hypothetical protein
MGNVLQCWNIVCPTVCVLFSKTKQTVYRYGEWLKNVKEAVADSRQGVILHLTD